MTKAAIITGAGTGIGRATAVELSGLGYACLLVGRSEATLKETRALAGRCELFVADVSDASAAGGIVRAAVERFGRIDVLINNAGYAPMVRVRDLSPEQWRKVIDTNLSAVVWLVRAAWPVFEQQKSGTIVNISSESARDPFIGLGAYGAAKAGLNLLTKALASEGAEVNVRAHCIAPGAVETQMLRGIVSKEDYGEDKTLPPEAIARVIGQC
ncbi:MAG TPA: SDR family oxidoreductase, partial [Tepidisphaeraceae bacterium]